VTKWPTTKFGEDACPEIFGPGLGCPRSGKIAEKTQASIPSTVYMVIMDHISQNQLYGSICSPEKFYIVEYCDFF